MQKVWNALRYGNLKTKLYIILIGLLLVVSVVTLISSIVFSSPLFGMIAIFSFVLAMIFMSSVSFQGPITKRIIEKKQKDKKEIKADNIEEEEEEEEPENGYLEKYDEDKIEKLFVSYKANKTHLPIMIDECQSEKIHQCPAYLWIEKEMLYLLLLEKKPRMVQYLLKKNAKLTYEKGVIARPEADYPEFKTPSFVSLVFGSLLPTVYEDRMGTNRQYRKNLYVIGSDLKVTNTSAKTVMSLLCLDVTLQEEEIYTKSYSPYFTASYKLSVQLRDQVMTVKEYKERMKDVLKSLCDANISFADYNRYMKQLVDGRLITQDYADYYMEYRKKQKKD